MGEGGDINVFNATPYTWRKTHQHSYQMTHWDFPDTIPPHTSATVYVEFDDGGSQRHPGDDAGEVYYEMVGCPAGQSVFYLEVGYKHLQARLPQFSAKTAPNTDSALGALIPLGWRHNGHVSFVLSGQFGNLWLLKDGA